MTVSDNVQQNVSPIVALDIGDVCIKIEVEVCAQKLGFKSLEEIHNSCPEIFSIAEKMERGTISSSEFLTQVREILDGNLPSISIEDAWNHLIGDEINGMAEVIEEIFAIGLTPIFFSNISDIHYNYVLEKLSFAKDIRDGVLSYKVGDVKPNSTMYEIMEEKFCNGGVPALYLDDREDNILTAKERGWNSYRVGNIGEIHKKLAEIKDKT